MKPLLILALIVFAFALWSAWHALAQGDGVTYSCWEPVGICMVSMDDVVRIEAYIRRLEKEAAKDCFLKQVGK